MDNWLLGSGSSPKWYKNLTIDTVSQNKLKKDMNFEIKFEKLGLESQESRLRGNPMRQHEEPYPKTHEDLLGLVILRLLKFNILSVFRT